MKNQKENKENSEITHAGELKFGGITVPCFVLRDGTRIISGRGVQEALRIRDRPEDGEKRGGYILPTFLQSKALKPFVDSTLEMAKLNPRKCYRGNIEYHGFEATALTDLCDAILDARNSGAKLTDRQQIVAVQCEIIVRSLARVGIIALVDEATGYQEVRDKDALQKFLARFLNEEQAKWIKTFPDEFFEMIFRFKGLTWTTANKGKKPQWIGYFINNYVYSRLAPKVLSELRRLNPKNEDGKRKGKHTQWIDMDYGHPKLIEHLNLLVAFAQAAGYNESNWKRMIERARPQFKDGTASPQLPFNDIE